MNKILNINLGGMPFTIDIDAYSNLEIYLTTIKSHFSTSESCEEIIHDIEVRMAELFQESMRGSSIISNKELDDVIKIMGTPEDFGAAALDDDEEPNHNTSEPFSQRSTHQTGHKRLFRDADDKVIAGLCSGISAYLGINDPLWVRLAFVILVLSGISPILYLLMWVIVPTAKTASDKLSMRGENINISNIAKTVEEEISELSKRITEIGKDLGSKKKSGDIDVHDAPKRNFIVGILAGIIGIISSVLSGVFGLVKSILKPIVKLTSATLMIALAVAMVAIILAISFSLPFAKYVGPDSMTLSTLGSLSLYLTAGIPLFFGLAIITKSLLGFKMKQGWARSLGLMWIVSILLGSFSVAQTIKEYQVGNEITKTFEKEISTSSLALKFDDKNDRNYFVSLGDLKMAEEGLYIDDVDINIIKSGDHKIHITQTLSSRGSSKQNALTNASSIESEIIISDKGEIIIPSGFFVNKGEKYRGQNVKYDIALPEGIALNIEDNIGNYISHRDFDLPGDIPYNKSNYQWEMGANGLTSSDYIKENNHSLSIPVSSINSLFVEGNFDIDLVKGETASVTVVGKEDIVNNVMYDSMNGIVNITNPQSYGKPLKLYVYVTDLDHLSLENVAETRVDGLKQDHLAITNIGSGDIFGTLEITNLELQLDGRQNIDLMGKGESVNVKLGYNTNLNLEKYLVTNASISGRTNRNGKVNVAKKLSCDKNNLSYIKVVGNPVIEDFTKVESDQM